MNIHDHEAIREDIEFRLSLLRLMTMPAGEPKKTEGEAQLEKLYLQAGVATNSH